jgi:hypothetical protein
MYPYGDLSNFHLASSGGPSSFSFSLQDCPFPPLLRLWSAGPFPTPVDQNTQQRCCLSRAELGVREEIWNSWRNRHLLNPKEHFVSMTEHFLPIAEVEKFAQTFSKPMKWMMFFRFVC